MMIRYKRQLIFDTSAINDLADDPNYDAVVGKVKATFTVRLTSANIEEVAATKKPARRRRLLDVCRELLPAGQCILAFHEIITELAKRFDRNPSFNWRNVRVRFPEAEQEIWRPTFILSDQLATQQYQEMRNRDSGFMSVFKQARPHFQELFAKGEIVPHDLPELVRRLKIDPGAFWALGINFYRRATGKLVDEDTIRKFIDTCPPFNALLLAVCMAEYEHCMRDLKTEVSYRAGMVDLCSAVYLPYCDVFVTAEKRQRQENALKEIVRTGKFGIPILSYHKWRDDLMRPLGFAVGA
jgi:hypothetical protein